MTDQISPVTETLAKRFEDAFQRYRPEVFGEDDKIAGPALTRTECMEIAAALRKPGLAQTPDLREALERFAKRVDDHAPYARDDTIVHFRLRDCRAAKAALSDTSTERSSK